MNPNMHHTYQPAPTKTPNPTFPTQAVGPDGIMHAPTNADIAFRFLGVVSLDYVKVMGACLSITIATVFILGPAAVEYL